MKNVPDAPPSEVNLPKPQINQIKTAGISVHGI